MEGPALPPHLIKNKSCEVIGPVLPPHLREKLIAPPDSEDDDDDDECYGPLPEGVPKTSAQVALEERALQMKLDKLKDPEDEKVVREEWMLELPEVKAANFGLGPRQFRSKQGPDMSDRSSWTDTPSTKDKRKKKKDVKKEADDKVVVERDEEQEKISRKCKRSKESLVEMHQKKLKTEKKKDDGGERRPFNRETDLQVNRFDEAQKKAVLKKAQLLDDRFSSGQAKFL